MSSEQLKLKNMRQELVLIRTQLRFWLNQNSLRKIIVKTHAELISLTIYNN